MLESALIRTERKASALNRDLSLTHFDVYVCVFRWAWIQFEARTILQHPSTHALHSILSVFIRSGSTSCYRIAVGLFLACTPCAGTSAPGLWVCMCSSAAVMGIMNDAWRRCDAYTYECTRERSVQICECTNRQSDEEGSANMVRTQMCILSRRQCPWTCGSSTNDVYYLKNNYVDVREP